MNVASPILTTPRKLGLRVEDFLLLDASGAFDGYGKTELIDGDIYVMNAQYTPHARAKSRLAYAITTCLQKNGSDLEAIVEVAVFLNAHSMPEPDIIVTYWRGTGPVPVESVALVVEVSDTTLASDLGRKAELYAAAGILEYWVIDLNAGRAVMHVLPGPDGYIEQTDVLLTESLLSATIADLAIDGAEVTR